MSQTRKLTKRASAQRGAPIGPVKTEDTRVLAVANFLRNEKKSGLKTKEAVQYEKRVEYFKGAKLVDTLCGPKYSGALKKKYPIGTRTEAGKMGQDLLRLGYIHRSQRVQHAHVRRWELELVNGPFEEDGLYTWVYEGSKTKLYLLCAGSCDTLKRRAKPPPFSDTDLANFVHDVDLSFVRMRLSQKTSK